MKRERAFGWAGALVMALAGLNGTPAAAADHQAQRASAPASWRAKYCGGTEELKKIKDVSVDFSSDALELRAHEKTVLSIPLDKITQVESQNLRPAHAALAGLKTAGQVEGDFASLSFADAGGSAILFGMFGFVPTMAVSSAVHSKDKYAVKIVWGKASEQHDAQLRLGANEYSSFLSKLQSGTRKPWFDLRAEERKIGKQAQLRTAITLEHPARVNDQTLKKGRYQVVCVESENAPSRLVFIAGDTLNPHKIRAVVPVERLAEGASASDGSGANEHASPAIIERDGTVDRVTQVNFADKQFRLKQESKAAPADSQASSRAT